MKKLRYKRNLKRFGYSLKSIFQFMSFAAPRLGKTGLQTSIMFHMFSTRHKK